MTAKERVLFGTIYLFYTFLIVISPASFGGPTIFSDWLLRGICILLPLITYVLDGQFFIPSLNDIRIVLSDTEKTTSKVITAFQAVEFPIDALSVVKQYKYKFDTPKTLKRITRLIVDVATKYKIPLTHVRNRSGLRVNSYIFHPEYRKVERKGVIEDVPVKRSEFEKLAQELKRPLGGTDDIGFGLVPGTDHIQFTKASINQNTSGLGNILSSAEFARIIQRNKHGQVVNLPAGLGVNIDGIGMAIDLQEGPHFRLVGATKSGKSVAATTMIASLLALFPPECLEIRIIDLKLVDFTIFKKFPHLKALALDPTSAVEVLDDAIQEMQRRFQLMNHAGFKNIMDYNMHITNPEDFIPNYLLLIDEYSELLGSGSKDHARDVTQRVIRIAQASRAAGMTLILGSQRLDSGVTNPLIKANTPSVFGLKTSTASDSRVAIDQNGCEVLLGNGDTLLKFNERVTRMQFCYVSDKEITGLAKLWAARLKKDPG